MPVDSRPSLFLLSFPSSPPQNVEEIQNVYETHFPELTEKFFKDKNTYQPWPTSDTVADLVRNDPVFLHLFAQTTPNGKRR